MSMPETTLLHGRQEERAALAQLLCDVRSGQSRALVLRGAPGIGKTALLEDLCGGADGFLLVRGGGVESEAELPFAGLHHICSQMIEEKLDLLPDPQREAIRVAFGESSGGPPDPFLIGLAVLNRLADVAEEQPVLCVVDDAQWLDRASAQTLGLVGRRLGAEAVGIVFAVRDPIEQLDGLPELVVPGLAPDDARDLLRSVLTVPLDEAVLERFILETQGNPLALLELPHGLSAAELAGGFGLEGARGVSTRVEEGFQRRYEALPAETRLLLLTVAAEPVGDPLLLWRAASLLGIALAAAEPAEADGLISIGVRVAFRHPLARSAVYRVAAPDERRRVHRALAEVTDPEADPDRRAWHLAQAAPGADEAVAAELEQSAGRAQARGGIAAAAAFLTRAVALTPDPQHRGQRALAAAHANLSAGAPDEASALVPVVQASPLDELGVARLDLLRAQVAFAVNRRGDAPASLLRAAKGFEALEPRLARDTYLDALSAALFAGRLSSGVGVFEVAKAARAAPRQSGRPRASDLLLDGLAITITDGYAAGAPALKRAVSAFRDANVSAEGELRWLWLACRAAMMLLDYEGWLALSRRQVEIARNAGALSVLPMALTGRVGAHLQAGEFASAASLVEEVAAAGAAAATQAPPYAAVALAAWRGREAEATALFDSSRKVLAAVGQGVGITFVEWMTAVLYNGLGRYEQAQVAAQSASDHPEDLWSAMYLPELIEAAARSGNRERAVATLRELSEITCVSGTDWALGLEAQSRALVSDDDTAEGAYHEAIDHLERSPARLALARAHLLYGEWLRREGRRADSRGHLRTAYEMLAPIGAEAFAARAARELAATGERVKKRTVQTRDDLTAQEAQIARLGAEGYSNRQIGEQLFISHRTVGYHLHKVFSKLDISNRAQLHGSLDSDQIEVTRSLGTSGTAAS
jgi:DNA-binding CsgD family transcriptional regulator